MQANEEYKSALADLKNFCSKETAFDVDLITTVYPLVAVFKPKAQLGMFDSENYNVDENGEIGNIQIVFGTSTKVLSSLRFKMDAKLLKKFIKMTEKVAQLYLHAFFEEKAAATYEAWLEEQAKAAAKAAAIKQAAEAARSGKKSKKKKGAGNDPLEYTVLAELFDCLEEKHPETRSTDLAFATGGDTEEDALLSIMEMFAANCKSNNVIQGKPFKFKMTLTRNGQNYATKQGTARWNGREVEIE